MPDLWEDLSPSLALYLKEAVKWEPLDSNEEKRLARRIKQGDKSAEDKLVSANLLFVVSIAYQYVHKGLPLCDLVSEGNLGLIEAVKRFDEERGVKFISYAVLWIKEAILLALATQTRNVRVPMHWIRKRTAWEKTQRSLSQKNGRQATLAEVAEADYADGYQESLMRMFNGTDHEFHFDDLVPHSRSTGRPSVFLDFLSDPGPWPDEILNDFQEHERLVSALRSLTEREAMVLDLSFGLTSGEAMTLEDIGKKN